MIFLSQKFLGYAKIFFVQRQYCITKNKGRMVRAVRTKDFLYFMQFGIKTVIFRKKDPILGTIILTDKCNLQCKHCAVNNITAIIHPYEKIRREMVRLYDMGIRILFFCGGETFLWEDDGKTVRDLVIEAKKMGFLIVNVVTNGTFSLNLPEADLILLSLDGDRDAHNAIRGDTYDLIMKNIQAASRNNICFYMAINQLNKDKVRKVCDKAKELKNVRAVSFNFHTPYLGTEEIQLTLEDKEQLAEEISLLMEENYPIFNLKSALPYVVHNNFPTPCYQCVVLEDGKISVCGRCIEEEGLCQKCGYFFVAEYTLLFSGKIKIIVDMFRTYFKYI